MKKEYDFSSGKRGKFYSKDAKFNLPIYLDKKTLAFVESIAEKKKTDISTVANELLKRDMEIVEASK